MDRAASASPTPAIDSTWFKARWAEYARRRGLADSHDALVVLTEAELRREALEFFSWGCVHQAVAQQRLEELLPTAG